MKHHIICSIMIAIVSNATVAHAWDSSENKIWIEGSLKGNLCDRWSVKLAEQVRYNEEESEYCYRHTDLSVVWKFLPGWAFSPAYRYASVIKADTTTSTPIWHFNLCNKHSWAGVDFKSRLRLFYSNLNHSEDRTDFRPKLTLIPTNGWTPIKLKPYVEDEIMINLNEGQLYLNRLCCGLKCNPIKRISCCAFIMQDLYENKTQTNWNERYHYGLFAMLNF